MATEESVRTKIYDREMALTAAQFMLSPEIPPSQRKAFERFYLMFSKTMALGNIERSDVMSILICFDEISMLYDMGLYDFAQQMMGRELVKMQLSRSVGGFQTLFGQEGIKRTESIQHIVAHQKKKRGSILPFRKKHDDDSGSGTEILP